MKLQRLCIGVYNEELNNTKNFKIVMKISIDQNAEVELDLS